MCARTPLAQCSIVLLRNSHCLVTFHDSCACKWFFVVDKLCKRDSAAIQKTMEQNENWTEKQLTKECTRIEYTKHDCVFLANFSYLRNIDCKWNDSRTWAACAANTQNADRNQWQSWFLFYKWMNAMGNVSGALECKHLLCAFDNDTIFICAYSSSTRNHCVDEVHAKWHYRSIASISLHFLLLSSLSVWETFHFNLLLLIYATPQIIM